MADIWFCDDFPQIAPEPSTKRATCHRCRRPSTVCWCVYLPEAPIKIRTKVTILQHPFEESRSLKTAPMIELGLEAGHCNILKGKRFSTAVHPELSRLLEDPNTLVMYPGKKAVNISEVVGHSPNTAYNLILLDGTWMQAKSIFSQNPFLHQLKQVQLKNTGLSEYVIRTQPTDTSLSTVEAAVFSIAILENRPDIIQPLLRPLRALCDFQMRHGAVKHQSKQYLIENGLYEKELPSNRKNTALRTGPNQQSSPANNSDVNGFKDSDGES